MKIEFSKYHGAGNDFIIVDSRKNELILSEKNIAFLCHRRFGIGGDGLMTIHKSDVADFDMKYYNSDGKEASMCGNGGRCISLFALKNNIATNKMIFSAIDGLHSAIVTDNEVNLAMTDVNEIIELKDGYFLNTGSPHFVKIVEDIEKVDVYIEGKALADDKRFAPQRTNVNFIELSKDKIKIATYERGVEDETLACGTGTVAAAIVANNFNLTSKMPVKLAAKGGNLSVSFTKKQNTFTDIILTGPAEFVFSGIIEL